jgi:hypothetical protein
MSARRLNGSATLLAHKQKHTNKLIMKISTVILSASVLLLVGCKSELQTNMEFCTSLHSDTSTYEGAKGFQDCLEQLGVPRTMSEADVEAKKSAPGASQPETKPQQVYVENPVNVALQKQVAEIKRIQAVQAEEARSADFVNRVNEALYGAESIVNHANMSENPHLECVEYYDEVLGVGVTFLGENCAVIFKGEIRN